MRTKAIILAVAVVCVAFASLTGAAPKPDPGSRSWQLDITFHDPQRITIAVPGQGEVTYWYMLYTATNNTGQDVQFFPSTTLVTDQLEAVVAGEEVHPRAYDYIAARHKKEYPFFAKPSDVTGLLLQGRANARTSAAVFKTFSDEADGFTVFTAGLSGEITRVANPSFDKSMLETSENPRAFVLRKSLAIIYDLPGDKETKSSAEPIRRTREWVMR